MELLSKIIYQFAEEYEIDYERKRALEYTIKEVERQDKKQKKKIKRADNGFIKLFNDKC